MRKQQTGNKWEKRQTSIMTSDENTMDVDINMKMEKLNNFEKGRINKNNYFYYYD